MKNNPPATLGVANSYIPGGYYEDPARFNSAITTIGRNVIYRKSHICPCGGVTGSPDPQCLQCAGFGRYWDAPNPTTFICVISFSMFDDPGVRSRKNAGSVEEAIPLLTIPSTATDMWLNMTLYDQIILPDSIIRYTTNLTNGQYDAIPYSYQVNISPTGAVTTYNSNTHYMTPVTDYWVSETNGITHVGSVSSDVGAPLAVEYTAAQAFVAYGLGSMPHTRPDMQGFQMPKRYHLQPLDIWMRGHSATGN